MKILFIWIWNRTGSFRRFWQQPFDLKLMLMLNLSDEQLWRSSDSHRTRRFVFSHIKSLTLLYKSWNVKRISMPAVKFMIWTKIVDRVWVWAPRPSVFKHPARWRSSSVCLSVDQQRRLSSPLTDGVLIKPRPPTWALAGGKRNWPGMAV